MTQVFSLKQLLGKLLKSVNFEFCKVCWVCIKKFKNLPDDAKAQDNIGRHDQESQRKKSRSGNAAALKHEMKIIIAGDVGPF